MRDHEQNPVAGAAITFSLAVRAQAQTFTTLAAFNGVNGEAPFFGNLVQDTNGHYYGSTFYGGENGFGNIFQVTSAGKLTSLYSFCALEGCTGGLYPVVAPILGSDGNLYGTTASGGRNDAGTVYKMTIGGKLTTLYSFCGMYLCADGGNPAGLIQGSNGKFYGVVQQGGAGGSGTFFELTSLGQFKLLHIFCAQQDCGDGASPGASPMQATNGNFYGTATVGGLHGTGVVYEITPAGSYKALYNFCSQTNCADGSYPQSTLVQDANGNLYGTTFYGGAYGDGTVFKITPSDQYIVLHSFDGADDTDGEYPRSAPTLANDGNLYGTTTNGSNNGNIYQITPEGTYTSIYSFCNASSCNASGAAYGLLQGTDGILYGAATNGGTTGDGIVYSFSNHLSPLVKTVPLAAAVGARVIILGNGLTGSTSVRFNGVSAAFTVNSDTYITATVPRGATTGTVQVITPTQTLNSNPVFQVLSQ